MCGCVLFNILDEFLYRVGHLSKLGPQLMLIGGMFRLVDWGWLFRPPPGAP